MFIGHFAVALAAKRVAPKTSLGTLFIAAQFLDILWPVMLLLGVEHVRIDPGNTPMTPLDFYDYPISHSLAMTLVWGVALGGLYFFARRIIVGAVVVALTVASHWVLDFVTHRPDLLLLPGGTESFGLGLWYSIPGTLIVEGAMFVIALLVYRHAFPPTNSYGQWSFWLMMLLLPVLWMAAVFGPPPPTVDALAYSAMAIWLLIPWAYSIDRHRAGASIQS